MQICRKWHLDTLFSKSTGRILGVSKRQNTSPNVSKRTIETSREHKKTLRLQGHTWWTHKGSNLGPLPCEGNALPLSYASGIFVHNQGPAQRRPIGRYASFVAAIYEVRGGGVKLSIGSVSGGFPAWARTAFESRISRLGDDAPLARLLLAGAGGVGLQRPDAFSKRPAALRHAARGRAIGAGAVDGLCRLGRYGGIHGGQHGFDRRIRAFELHREFRHLGGDVVDAFAQQRVFHALGRPGAFGLLLDRVDVALQLGALVAGEAKLLLDRRLLLLQSFDRGHLAAVQRRDFGAQFPGRAFGHLAGLAQLVVFEVALGEQLALGGKALLKIVDAVAEQLGFLDLQDELAVEIGDALAEIFDAAARLDELARRLLGVGAFLLEPRPRGGEFLFGVADAVLQIVDLGAVGSSRVDLQACKLEYSIVSPK